MRALLYIATALAGCATAPSGPAPAARSAEEAFRGAGVVALVHRVAAGEARRRDPLDALQEALEERGREVVALELGGRPPEALAAVDALAGLVEALAERGGAEDGRPGAASVGDRAAPALARIGADALAVYVRGRSWGSPRPSPFFGQPTLAPPPAVTSAIALVARDGTVAVFAWGAGDPYDGSGLGNAAEAVDAALALLVPASAE